MIKRYLITALWLALGTSSPAWADNIYKWVDAQGGVHYGDQPQAATARLVNLSTPAPPRKDNLQWEAPAAAQPALSQAAGTTQATQRVNINTANTATLATLLHGVGPKKAAAIIAHRQKHGPFKSADALNQVKGIGEKTLEKNRARIVVR